MRKLVFSLCLLIAAPVFMRPVVAQDMQPKDTQAKKPDAFYHLSFVLRELGEDGKIVNSRTYQTDVSDQSPISSIRTGTRIPIHVSSKEGDVQYLDVGVNIDCNNAHETPQGLAVTLKVEVSSLTASSVPEPTTPIIRQNRWSTETVLPMGKPTIAFSSDNLENKGRMQVEVTATPLR